ncbi:hypothetical protein CIK05_05430 [Bdellovibrio sp. qaytius]|nr:hypothetical protein CIK05_05430 [Bdellovibrio sp. qaytius]
MSVKIFLGILVITTWLSSHVFFAKSFDRFQELYIPPPKAIQHLTAGFNVQVADAFWLRAVQDFDYCSKKISQNVCEGNSWLFSVLDLSSTLDPKLEPIMYQTAGLALSILVGDVEGGAKIFDRGVQVYPDNWQIIYGAAYHALYEEKNKMKASKLYLRASEIGAPKWTQVLAARLASDEGESEFADKILEDMVAQNKDEKLIIRLKTKLLEAKAKNNSQKQ